ncbi:unnamed protein product [Cyprideis torosa]|uniref:Uncharacterized protein n=1 Tax=Cyprideis torosa TaxID=163714 RepID=A0A7R8ZQS1_9CRUS|nr:unnamed protein product [Cyprideis torosa]CAG0892623.1 unnamed protein product [Cyprideis torosa]
MYNPKRVQTLDDVVDAPKQETAGLLDDNESEEDFFLKGPSKSPSGRGNRDHARECPTIAGTGREITGSRGQGHNGSNSATAMVEGPSHEIVPRGVRHRNPTSHHSPAYDLPKEIRNSIDIQLASLLQTPKSWMEDYCWLFPRNIQSITRSLDGAVDRARRTDETMKCSQSEDQLEDPTSVRMGRNGGVTRIAIRRGGIERFIQVTLFIMQTSTLVSIAFNAQNSGLVQRESPLVRGNSAEEHSIADAPESEITETS